MLTTSTFYKLTQGNITTYPECVMYEVLYSGKPFAIHAPKYRAYAQGDTEDDAIKKLHWMLEDITKLDTNFILVEKIRD